MTDQEKNFILGEIIFAASNQEIKLWPCLGQTCSRSLIVFLSQPFVILLINFGCFWRTHLIKTCDEYTAWVEKLCMAAAKFLPSTWQWTIYFLRESESFFIGGWSLKKWKIATDIQLVKNWHLSTKVWQNLLFCPDCQPLDDVMQKSWEFWFWTKCKIRIYQFVERQLYKVLIDLWRFNWRDLQFKSACWYCYHWK